MRRPLLRFLTAAFALPIVTVTGCGDNGATATADAVPDMGDSVETPDSASDIGTADAAPETADDTATAETAEDTATAETAEDVGTPDGAPDSGLDDATPDDVNPDDVLAEDTTVADTTPDDTTPDDTTVADTTVADTAEPPTAGYLPVANGSFESPEALSGQTPAPDGWRHYALGTAPSPASWVVGDAADYGVEASEGAQVLVVSSTTLSSAFRYNDTPVDTNIQPGDLYIVSAKVRMLSPDTTARFAVGLAVSDRPANIVETELNPATVAANGAVIDTSDAFIEVTARMNVRRLQRGKNLYPFIFATVTAPIVIDEIRVWREIDTGWAEPPGGIVPNPAFDHASLFTGFTAPGWLGWDTSACTRPGDARTLGHPLDTTSQPLPPGAAPFGELTGCEVKTVAAGLSLFAGQNVRVTAQARAVGVIGGPGGNGGAGAIPLRFFVEADGLPRLLSPEPGVANGTWQRIVWCFQAQNPATNPTFGMIGTAQVDDVWVEVGVPTCP